MKCTRGYCETPVRIGARNPFVYAEHKLGKKINWHKMNPGTNEKNLKMLSECPMTSSSILKMNPPLFVKTGDLRPCATVSNPQWAPNPAGSNYTVTSRAYNDPVQGDLPDCFLIAALSSLAFLNMIPDKLPPFTYTFYKPPAVEGGVPIADAPVVDNK